MALQFHALGLKVNVLVAAGDTKRINMKKTFLMALMVMLSVAAYAQQSVTKFLGIPVDGTKSEMIRKLEAKGFRYNPSLDRLEGEFNGTNVNVLVVTNNNKVWRILLMDKITLGERDIRVRFNRLVGQFNTNLKYYHLTGMDYIIPEDEDISYQMTVKNKRYEATYFQWATDDSGNVEWNPEKNRPEDLVKRSVWFVIGEQYGEYRILMYYDNGYNQANGEDL